jgi:hypothetical protein
MLSAASIMSIHASPIGGVAAIGMIISEVRP